MHAHHLRPRVNRLQARRNRPLQALLRRHTAQHSTKRTLARRRQQHRIAKARQSLQITHQQQILLHILGKADTGIQNNLISTHTALTQKLRSLRQINGNLLHNILVLAVLLHILRRTAHMHKDNRRFSSHNHISHARVSLHRTDIVDNISTGSNSCLRRIRTIGINRNNSIGISLAQSSNRRNYAAALLLPVNAVAARTGRLTADIQNTGTRSKHSADTLHQLLHSRNTAALIKGIWRNVQNAHHAQLLIGQHSAVSQSSAQLLRRQRHFQINSSLRNAKVRHLRHFLQQYLIMLQRTQKQDINILCSAGNSTDGRYSVAAHCQHLLLDNIRCRSTHTQQLERNNLRLMRKNRQTVGMSADTGQRRLQALTVNF